MEQARRVRPSRAWALLVVSSVGFSTIETSAIMGATSILAATATPQLKEYLESARGVKAAGDVRVIALSIIRLTSDVHRIRMQQKVSPHLLVSDGDTPSVADAAGREWTRPLNGAETQPLAAHLITNDAAYPAGSPFSRWRGPYMQQLSPDPWGSRYAANVGLLEQPGSHAVLVISAGPNRIIETPFEAIGLQTGGDDVAGVIGRGR
jgi:hypothetical protein